MSVPIARRAGLKDLPEILALLAQDTRGRPPLVAPRYAEVFEVIQADPRQYLMVIEVSDRIVGTCHLTILPSLTYGGMARLHIEAVRIDAAHRGKKLGEWMISQAIAYGRAQGVGMVQLMTHADRTDAQRFYARLGFLPTHVGMKLNLE